MDLCLSLAEAEIPASMKSRSYYDCCIESPSATILSSYVIPVPLQPLASTQPGVHPRRHEKGRGFSVNACPTTRAFVSRCNFPGFALFWKFGNAHLGDTNAWRVTPQTARYWEPNLEESRRFAEQSSGGDYARGGHSLSLTGLGQAHSRRARSQKALQGTCDTREVFSV